MLSRKPLISKFLPLTGIFFLGLTTFASANDGSPNIKSELIGKLNTISSLTAAFNQSVTDEEGNALQSAQGELTISRPNKVFWHTQTPDESMIIANGKDIWFYDPFIEQVSIYDFKRSVANTPMLLLTSSDEKVWNNYKVAKKSDSTYVVTSLAESSQVVSLSLSFKDTQLTAFEILDATGQKSLVQLSKQQENIVIDNALFSFTVPEGVSVDDQR